MKHTLGILIALLSGALYADNLSLPTSMPEKITIQKPLVTPSPPAIDAKAYILIDVDSGKVLAEKDSNIQLPPASLTKMMTLYVVSEALKSGQVHLTDKVHINEAAWRTEGSRMFVKVGDEVSVQDLLQGIIVASGNDACVALAEHIGGSEEGFVQLMNQEAARLGMKDSHFTDSTGLDNPELHTTARDLAILGRALATHFPEYYHWYGQKWFTYNNIRQPNRNRLLWRSGQVDGIKTGHTDTAGFCLVASAKRNNMRLLSVVMGAPNDNVRTNDSEKLLNYGFHFFETYVLYKPGQVVKSLPLYKGEAVTAAVGPKEAIYVTIPAGQARLLRVTTQLPERLQAPITQYQEIGILKVTFDNQALNTYPLYTLNAIPKGGIFTRMKDSVRWALHA